MKIQVNSDKTISVDRSLIRFVESQVGRALARFAKNLTRVEVHLSDVDSSKTGSVDKRCLIEVRPAGSRPLSVTAMATKMAAAIAEAAGKMQRSLTTFFGRRGRSAVAITPRTAVPRSAAKKAAVAPKRKAAKKKAPIKAAAVEEPDKPSPRGPKKKRIYQARRKPWPAR